MHLQMKIQNKRSFCRIKNHHVHHHIHEEEKQFVAPICAMLLKLPSLNCLIKSNGGFSIPNTSHIIGSVALVWFNRHKLRKSEPCIEEVAGMISTWSLYLFVTWVQVFLCPSALGRRLLAASKEACHMLCYSCVMWSNFSYIRANGMHFSNGACLLSILASHTLPTMNWHWFLFDTYLYSELG